MFRPVQIALLLLVLPRALHAQAVSDRGTTRRSSPDSSGAGWKLSAIDLDVIAHPDSQVLRVAGELSATAPAGESFGPDLLLASSAMQFDSVEAAGARIQLSPQRDTARVRFARPAAAGTSVTIRFHARAQRPRLARSVAIGQEGAFASWFGNWYPFLASVKGEQPAMQASGRLRLAIPGNWKALSNGRLADTESVGAWRHERWESTKPLVWSFIAAPYNVTRHRVGTTDVAIYLMPRQAAKAPAFAAAIPDMVQTLEKIYGPYPYETFGLAAIPAGIAPPGIGGRSEQGYFLTHEHALDGDTVDVPIFAHELAHMWWGNTVLSDPPGDDMVDEGMASYGATLVVEARYGRAAARRYMRDGSIANSEHTFFHLWRIGADEPLMDDFATLPSYSKGAWFYEMLRERIGDSLYFGTLRQFIRDYTRRSATLRDVRNAFLRVAPPAADLERFFADWLDRAGAPVLQVRWSPTTAAGKAVARVQITQRTAPYRLPLEVEVISRQGAERSRVVLRDSIQSFVLPARSTPTAVRLDPDHELMLWEPAFGPIPGVTAPQSEDADRAWLREELTWLRYVYGVGHVSVGVVRNYHVDFVSSAADTTRDAGESRKNASAWRLNGLAPAVRELDPHRFPAVRDRADVDAITSLWADALAAAAGRAGASVSADAVRAMMSPGDSVSSDPYGATRAGGLGFRLASKNGATRVSFVENVGGQTIVLLGYPGSGSGCVVISDDERSGIGLATQIAQRIAVIGHWPEIPGRE